MLTVSHRHAYSNPSSTHLYNNTIYKSSNITQNSAITQTVAYLIYFIIIHTKKSSARCFCGSNCARCNYRGFMHANLLPLANTVCERLTLEREVRTHHFYVLTAITRTPFSLRSWLHTERAPVAVGIRLLLVYFELL